MREPMVLAAVFAVAVLLTCGNGPISAAVVTFAPVADGEYNYRTGSTTYQGTTNGSSMRMGIIKVGSQYRIARDLLKFDLSGIDLASVESATLHFTVYSESGMGGVSGPNDDIQVWRSNNDAWEESGSQLTGVPYGGLSRDSLLGTFDMPNYVDSTTGGMSLSLDLLSGGWVPTDEDDFLSLVLNKTPDYVTTTPRYYSVLTTEWDESYASAVGPSLVLELADPAVPEPASMLVWSVLGCIGLVGASRRRNRV